MLFNSFQFSGIVLITFLFYYLPFFQKIQIHILIAASLFIYAYNQPYLLILLIISIVINAGTVYLIRGTNQKNIRIQKLWATIGILMNLGILILFKYSFLLASTLSIGSDSFLGFLLTIPLPIGISFYTFHGISFLVDTLREQKSNSNSQNVKLGKHILDSSLYMSFFPQLVAGPIVKSKYFLPQIKTKKINSIEWEKAFEALVTGYFLKLVIADNMTDQTYWINYPYFINKSTPHLGILLFGYSIQIFADFAGYSLIAIGLAKLFGYNLIDNFNFPYISKSFSEFWNRWHISLSSWLKEYLYFPLGGNKKGNFRTYFNLILVMFIGGLWHGAAWSYAIWGLFHGLLLAIERLFKGKLNLPDSFLVKTFRILIVFSFVTFGWLLFKLPNFSHVILYLDALFNHRYWEFNKNMVYILLYSTPVVLYHLFYLYKNNYLINYEKLKPVAYGIMLFLILINSGTASEFIYFQF